MYDQWPQGNFNEETTLDTLLPICFCTLLGTVCTVCVQPWYLMQYLAYYCVHTYDGGKFPCGLIQMLSMPVWHMCIMCVHRSCACMMVHCTYMKCRASLVPRPHLQLFGGVSGNETNVGHEYWQGLECYRHVRNVVHIKFDIDHPPSPIFMCLCVDKSA